MSEPGAPISPGCSVSMSAATASLSVVSGETTSGCASNTTSATRPSCASREPHRERLRRRRAATCRRLRRAMLLETSMTSTRFASRATIGTSVNPAYGPASATSAAATPMPRSHGRNARAELATPRRRSGQNRRASRVRARSRIRRKISASGTAASSQSIVTLRKLMPAPSSRTSRPRAAPARAAPVRTRAASTYSSSICSRFGAVRRVFSSASMRRSTLLSARASVARKILAAGGLGDRGERRLIELAADVRVDRLDLAGERILPLHRQRHRPLAADADRVDLDPAARRELRGDARIDRAGVVHAVGDEDDHAAARLRRAQPIDRRSRARGRSPSRCRARRSPPDRECPR